MRMQSRKAFHLDAEQSHRIGATGFGEHALTIIKSQAPGLMDASTANRLQRPQCSPRQGTIESHKIVPQA